MAPKKLPPVTADQPSSVAVVYYFRGWRYHDRLNGGRGSTGFKLKDLAVKAALENGFGAVMFEGKVIARKAVS